MISLLYVLKIPALSSPSAVVGNDSVMGIITVHVGGETTPSRVVQSAA